MIAAAIILAAGRGSRMGGPKALLIVEGEALVIRHVRRLGELRIPRILVVAPSAIAHEVARNCPGAQVLGADTSSQAASLRVGMLALEAVVPLPRDALVLVTPVDALPVRKTTIEALLAALHEGASAAVPQHAGRNGHPVLVRRRLLDAYTTPLEPPALNAHLAPHRTPVEIDDPNTVTNLNRPEDTRPGAHAEATH